MVSAVPASVALPELPDIDVYVAALQQKLSGRRLNAVRIGNPFFLRSVSPAPAEAQGRRVEDVRRIGKRIAIGFENALWIVLHLMVAGRLRWHARPPSLAARQRLAAFDFETGSILCTEAGTKKRASMYVVAGEAGLNEHDPGGVEPLGCTAETFAAAVRRENHTLKRTLTDPRILSGIGNAYSDEILHAARLSPVALSQKLDDEQVSRLYDATVATLTAWRDRLMLEADGELPAGVTAFRDGMAVHGRYGKPCPVCAEPVQRIRYRDNETNYCARCQTNSRILRDRSLSRLLKNDWPGTLDDL